MTVKQRRQILRQDHEEQYKPTYIRHGYRRRKRQKVYLRRKELKAHIERVSTMERLPWEDHNPMRKEVPATGIMHRIPKGIYKSMYDEPTRVYPLTPADCTDAPGITGASDAGHTTEGADAE
jgi:hypothetical protein